MTEPLNLTNQALIKELHSRVEAGHIEFQVIPDHAVQSDSLLSQLGSKEWLLLIGLSVVFTCLLCYSLRVTTNPMVGGTVGLRENKNPTVEIGEFTHPQSQFIQS